MGKTLYIQCNMGVAGDMLTAALSELVDGKKFLDKINSLGLQGVEVRLNEITKQGIIGNKIDVVINGVIEGECDRGTGPVTHSHEHHHHDKNHNHAHTTMQDVEKIINNLDLPDKVKSDAKAVYNLIAEAESKVHNTAISDIHFHEVGTMDAIADVVGVCLLMDMIAPDKIIASSINVGGGTVHCAHGVLPVPAPATALLLQDIPMYTDDKIQSELCTPTGAALIKYFADYFGNMPIMRVESTGYGFGTKEFETLNCVRVLLGEELDAEAKGIHSDGQEPIHCDRQENVYNNDQDTIIELSCNIDDMTPEDIGYTTEKLLRDGALDSFTIPIYMKKNRPGILLTVLCREDMRDKMVRSIFKYTTTIGVRESVCNRYILDRKESVRHTKYGDIRVKEVEGYGVKRSKPEYDDIVKAAEENNLSPTDIRKELT